MNNDNINNKIYHYTRIDILNNFILKNSEIRASQLLNTNDPKEYKRKVFGVGYSAGEAETIDPYISDNIINKFINKIKIISFCINDTNRKGYLKHRMWAQYGANNEGCCLEFDKSELKKILSEDYNLVEKSDDFIKKEKCFISDTIKYIDKNSIVQNNAVIYSKIDKKNVEESIILQKIPSLIKTFYEKDIDWISENEYRILLKSNKDDYELIKYKKSLKKIFLGEKVPFKIILNLIPICSENNIELYKLVWDHEKYVERKLTNKYILKKKIESEIFNKNMILNEEHILNNYGRKYWKIYMSVIHNYENEKSEKEIVDLLNIIKSEKK